MHFKRTQIAALIILIISWCTYQGYETHFFFQVSRTKKHLINFSLLLLVCFTGLYGFSRLSQRWVIGLWIPVYIFIIMLMVCIGLLDIYYKFPISHMRELIYNLRMFFTSPVPYGILLLLAHKTKHTTAEPASQT